MDIDVNVENLHLLSVSEYSQVPSVDSYRLNSMTNFHSEINNLGDLFSFNGSALSVVVDTNKRPGDSFGGNEIFNNRG